jgi:NDP-sugar pyrophosphorylase family protein
MSTVIVLCGGRGERLQSVVSDRPKVLAEVAGRPFLSFVLDRLEGDGATDIVLSAGYKADMIESFVSEKPGVRCISEPEPLGTGGAIRFAARTASIKEPFFVLNGDTWFDGNLGELAAFHREQDARLSLSLVEVADGSRYGQVEVDATGAVRNFAEKSNEAAPAWISAGLYLVEPGVLDLIPEGRKCSIEREIFPRLVGEGLFARQFTDASFLDIGTPEDYARAESLFSQ